MKVYGIDGCKSGWVVASAEAEQYRLGRVGFAIVTGLETIFSEADAGKAIAVIDIPIGLSKDSPRLCDLEARSFLGPTRGSSVFPAPCRCALDSRDYTEACILNKNASGKKLSRQSHAILKKIREIDCLVEPRSQKYVREAHPEVTFAKLAGHSMAYSKKKVAGRSERLAVLNGHGLLLGLDDVEILRTQWGRSAAAVDDIVDAAACLLTANRVRLGTHSVFPHVATPVRDEKGLTMEIVS